MNSKKNAISLFTPEEAADYNDITNNFFTPIYPFIANHIIQLNKENISSADIAGYENEVFSHFEVGLAILEGEANVGIGSVAASKILGLPFHSLKEESFDMILDQETFFKIGVQDFIETLNSSEFKKKVEPLGNYDFNESGKIIFSS